MSRRWPGWENLQGIDVEGGCNAARKQGTDYVIMRVMAGPKGVEGPLDMYPVAFHAAGHVSIQSASENWECVVEDGMLTGIRYAPDDITMKLVKALVVQVRSAEPLPFLHYYVAAEKLDGSYADVIDAAIDCSDNGDHTVSSALTIVSCPADNQLVSATWPLTPESASVLIGLMRERHGEPMGEMIADQDDVEHFSGMILDQPGTVGLTYHEHDTD